MDSTSETFPTHMARALAYAAHGIPVFPCQPRAKSPITANGFHDASTDPAVIESWWSRTPTANIAMPTGSPGFDVLDVDVRADGSGWAAFHQARRAGLTDGWLRVISTPSGGLHLHYPGSDQRNGSLRGMHVDFRGQGGYVLLPPSRVLTATYEAPYGLACEQAGPGRSINWAGITQLLQPPSPGRALHSVAAAIDGVEHLVAHVARQPAGNRNNALFWAACRNAEAGRADPEPLVAAAINAGLPEQQARRTVRSAYDTVARVPRPSAAATAAVNAPAR